MTAPRPAPPVLALTQGDPAGVGPEILLKVVAARLRGAGARGTGEGAPGEEGGTGGDRADAAPAASGTGPGAGFAGGPAWLPLLVAERAALAPLAPALPDFPWDRLAYLDAAPSREEVVRLAADGAVAVFDPVGDRRTVAPGQSGPADAAGALAALDAGIDLARRGAADALVTAPVAKASIARHLSLPDFTGHTDYIARACGLERYGRDYLMTFLVAGGRGGPGLKVALLTTHLPLAAALAAVRREAIEDALACLHRHLPEARRSIAVAGLNPHAGEDGLLGDEEAREIAPAVAAARAAGIDARGPESPDSLFARARRGEFDWVLALYHDQGLIAVKTAAFGHATNWTLGLPILRTSVDHGTAFAIAGRGEADAGPLAEVVTTTLGLVGARATL